MRAKTSDCAGVRKLTFRCPGCDRSHAVSVSGPYAWGFNESLDRPTLTPSVLVTYNGKDAGIDGAPPAICHSHVTDGQIAYCADSTHHLSGQTVDLPDLK